MEICDDRLPALALAAGIPRSVPAGMSRTKSIGSRMAKDAELKRRGDAAAMVVRSGCDDASFSDH